MKSDSAFVLWSKVADTHLHDLVARFRQLNVAVVEDAESHSLTDLPQLGRPLVYLVPFDGADQTKRFLDKPSATARYGVALTPDEDIGYFMQRLPPGALIVVFVGPLTSPQLIDALGAIRNYQKADHVSIVAFDHAGGRYAIQNGAKVAVRRPPKSGTSSGASAAEVLHRHLHLGFTIEEAICQPESMDQHARTDLSEYVLSAEKAPGTPYLLPTQIEAYLEIIDLHNLPLSRIWIKRADAKVDLKSPGLAHTVSKRVRAFDAPILGGNGDICILLLTDNVEGSTAAASRVRQALGDFLTEGEVALTQVDVDRVSLADRENLRRDLYKM